MMKKVECIIRPFKLEVARAALKAVGVSELIVSQVRGFGRDGGRTEYYRSSEISIDFLPKLKLEIVVEAGRVDEVIEIVRRTARTGHIGDGKVFVLQVEACVECSADADSDTSKSLAARQNWSASGIRDAI